MTREEKIEILEKEKAYMIAHGGDRQAEALTSAIQALEQDAVPFDFELYQAGLMDMPKGMVEVLDKIRAEIEESRYGLINDGLDVALKIIDKYIGERSDKE